MNRITYSLNYRKPKDEYNPNDELVVCLRYFHKNSSDDKGKIIKKSTGIKCKLSDWDIDWHKNPERFPIKESDNLFLKKNKLLKAKAKAFKFFISNIDSTATKNSVKLCSKVPLGPIADQWTTHKNNIRLVSPANKRLIDVIVVGTGLAGGSASATLAELGYNVKSFCFQDSPRRAHSIAAQGGINAAKNYQGDGDSTYRLFYDTVKGGDYRSRESNVYRLAEVSTNIIDQCVAQGVPFAREYGGLLDNRSFGGVLVSRTFYAKGQT